jgi:hypothetical protein
MNLFKIMRYRVSNFIRPNDEVCEQENIDYNLTSTKQSVGGGGDALYTKNFRLRVFPANGGTAIEFRYEDNDTPTSHEQLYIITDGMNLGEELAKIITIESLQIK